MGHYSVALAELMSETSSSVMLSLHNEMQPKMSSQCSWSNLLKVPLLSYDNTQPTRGEQVESSQRHCFVPMYQKPEMPMGVKGQNCFYATSHLTHVKKKYTPKFTGILKYFCWFYYDFSFSISHKNPYFYMILQRFSNALNTEVKLL